MSSHAPGHRHRLLLSLVALLLAILYAQMMLHFTDGEWILPIDDAYIHLQYGRRLAEGTPFQYSVGDSPSTGTTSLLYPAVLAIGALAGLGETGLVQFAFAVNALCLLLTALLLCELLSAAFGANTGVASALLVLLTGPIAFGFLSGMEVGLVCVLFLAAGRSLILDLRFGTIRWSALWLSLLALSRPEGMIYAVALVIGIAASRVECRRRVLLCAPIVMAVGTLALNYWIAGSVAPSSSHPKSPLHTMYFSPLFLLQHATNYYIFVLKGLLSGAFGSNPLATLNRIDSLAFVPPLSLLLYLVSGPPLALGELTERRFGVHTLLNSWLLFGVLFIGLSTGSGGHHFRYLTPFLAAYIAYLLPGALIVARSLVGDGARSAAGLVALVFAFQLLTTSNFLLVYGQQAYGFVVFKEAATWARDHTPKEAIIAALDVGMIAFYSDRRILDLYGLTTTDMTRSTFYFSDVMGSKYELLERMPPERRPDYFFAHRERFEEHGDHDHLAVLRQQLVFVARQSSPLYTVIGRGLGFYRLDWADANAGDRLWSDEAMSATSGLELVDRLDVADLDSHDAHAYGFEPPVTGVFPANRAVTAAYRSGRTLTDGAWGISGRERFSVTLPRTADTILVLRTNHLSGPVRVSVGGVEVGFFHELTDPSKWTEAMLEIPAAAVHAGKNQIEVAGTHFSAHYWVYQ